MSRKKVFHLTVCYFSSNSTQCFPREFFDKNTKSGHSGLKEISKKYVEKDEKARREKEEQERMHYEQFQKLYEEQNELVRQAQMGSDSKGMEKINSDPEGKVLNFTMISDPEPVPVPLIPVDEDPGLPEADEEEQIARAIALSMDPKEQQNPELSGLVEVEI